MKEEDIKMLPINVFIWHSDAEHSGSGGGGGGSVSFYREGRCVCMGGLRVTNMFCNIAK